MPRPSAWFPIALLVLAAGGAVALCRPECVPRDARDQQYYLERHIWERSFDAVSAACGAGLLTGDLARGYTPTGRWVLLTIGWIGALLYIAAAADASRRLIASERPQPPVSAGVPVVILGTATGSIAKASTAPSVITLWLVTLGVASLLTLGVWGAGRAVCPDVGAGETAWLVAVAFGSLGLASAPADPGTAQMLALVGWIGALGWPIWMLAIPPLRRRHVAAGPALRSAAAYTTFLMLAATVVSIIEGPRGGVDLAARGVESSEPDRTLSKQPAEQRWLRSVVAVSCAASAGIATEPLAERGLREGTKAVLALVLLVGGMGGSAAGGLKWPLLVAALTGGASPRIRRAAATCVLWMITLTLVTAAGLLLLESQVATRYQRPPTLADALLDATSAVAGGNLTSGLTATVTDRNLVSGIALGVNWYRLGMLWIVAAMLAGRLLPIVVLSRAAGAEEPSPRRAGVAWLG